MTTGANEAEIAEVERTLGSPLTPEHRQLLMQENGAERWYSDIFVMIYDTNGVTAVNQEIERHPGFVAFGSDGGGELLGLDTRRTPAPVVMINVASGGWSEAVFQADSLGAFFDQLASGQGLQWDTPYEP